MKTDGTKIMKQNVELLAPAGNLACALAAFDAGADAVYAGLKRFNARERTENFSHEDMSKLLGYASRNGKKVYITFNTLIKENELCDAAEELAALELLRPDAVIVQDTGALRLIRDYFPGLTIHASTQMGLHNSAGIAFARDLGVKRVILERQTTLKEIQQMLAAAPGMELEMFIHGALCCCISGSCLLSSWLGGWSGNRGKCKQPCRRRYHSDEGNGFFLSSQDLCTLELIPQIMTSGVRSLKIEGRLRRADYVENVVSAYRLSMDSAHDPAQFKEALPKAKELLAKTCGRKWSLGFYTDQSRKDLIKFDSLGASGQLCGKVLNAGNGGFTVLPSRRLHVGDVIRVQPRSGDEGPAVTITKMSIQGKPVNRALKDEAVFIHSDKVVTRDSLVYKTGESVGDYTKRIAALPSRKLPLDLQIALSRKELKIKLPNGITWRKPLDLAEAGTHPLTPETLVREFASAGTETIGNGSITAAVSENPFLPASVLKSLRKEFNAFLPDNLTEEHVRADNAARLEQFYADYRAMQPAKAPAAVAAAVPRGKHIDLPRGTAIAREIKDNPSPHEELILPFFIREKDLSEVRKSLADFVKRGGKCVRITSLHHFELLKPYPELKIKTCMPLPVCNSFAAAEVASHGAELLQAWLELGKTELLELAEKSPAPLEQYRFGRPVLLATHATIPAQGLLTDARGNAFRLHQEKDLTLLTAEKTMSVPAVKNIPAAFYDYRFADRAGKDPGIFNFDCGLS